MRKLFTILFFYAAVITFLSSYTSRENPDATSSIPKKQMRYQEFKSDAETSEASFPFQNIPDRYGAGILYDSIYVTPEGTLIPGARERGYLYKEGETGVPAAQSALQRVLRG